MMASREQSRARTIVLESLAVIYSLISGAFISDQASLWSEPVALGRVSIPALAAAAGLRWRDKHQSSATRPPHAAAVDVVVAYGLVLLTEFILWLLLPEWVLPRWAPTEGGFVGISLVVACRALFPPVDRLDPAYCGSADEIRGRIQVLRRRTLRTTAVYFVSCLVLSSVSFSFAVAGTLKLRVISVLILAGSAYLTHQLGVHAGGVVASTDTQASRLVAQYDLRLKQQRLLHRYAANWYYGSLLPATTLLVAGTRIYLYWLPLVVMIFAEVNNRQAAHVAQEPLCQ